MGKKIEQIYIAGNKVQFTGKEEFIHGRLFHEYQILTGHKAGNRQWTWRKEELLADIKAAEDYEMEIYHASLKAELIKNESNQTIKKMLLEKDVLEIIPKGKRADSYWAYRFDKASNYLTHEQWLLIKHGTLVSN